MPFTIPFSSKDQSIACATEQIAANKIIKTIPFVSHLIELTGRFIRYTSMFF
jgi:hypothetical protein